LRPALIVLESHRRFGISSRQQLHAADLPVVVVNPRQVRDFAKSLGQLAKTTRLDARVLAHFAAAIKAAACALIKSKEEQELGRLTGSPRPTYRDTRRREKSPCLLLPLTPCATKIEQHIDWLEKRIAELDQQLKRCCKVRPPGKSKIKSYKVSLALVR